MADQAVLTKQDLPEIIQRYLSGESVVDLAKESIVKPRQLYNWIMAETGEKYQALQTECLINRMADADMEMLQASTSLQYARARDHAKSTRWDLERRRPALFGPKQEIKQDTSITVIVQMVTPEPLPHTAPVILQAEEQAAVCLDKMQAE